MPTRSSDDPVINQVINKPINKQGGMFMARKSWRGAARMLATIVAAVSCGSPAFAQIGRIDSAIQ
ncbi:MAG TPA: hypothetical protein VG291_10285 [Xanthobacteraceae bacterium]|jgi:hypothetical protein|nr:hypothetical protein [Xanthobacteraceae bacterium]